MPPHLTITVIDEHTLPINSLLSPYQPECQSTILVCDESVSLIQQTNRSSFVPPQARSDPGSDLNLEGDMSGDGWEDSW